MAAVLSRDLLRFHWLIGVTALVGAVILVALTLITEFMSRTPAKAAMTLAARRNGSVADQPAQRRSAGRDGHVRPRADRAGGEANETYLPAISAPATSPAAWGRSQKSCA